MIKIFNQKFVAEVEMFSRLAINISSISETSVKRFFPKLSSLFAVVGSEEAEMSEDLTKWVFCPDGSTASCVDLDMDWMVKSIKFYFLRNATETKTGEEAEKNDEVLRESSSESHGTTETSSDVTERVVPLAPQEEDVDDELIDPETTSRY